MLLTEFFSSPEGDSYADHQTTKNVSEAKRISKKDDPCWSGYHMVSSKDKSSKEVPNCVPVEEDMSVSNLIATEGNEMSDVVTAKGLAGQALRNQKARQEYFDYLAHLRSKHGKEYSTKIHQQATALSSHKAI